jgi:hypothetical protein
MLLTALVQERLRSRAARDTMIIAEFWIETCAEI